MRNVLICGRQRAVGPDRHTRSIASTASTASTASSPPTARHRAVRASSLAGFLALALCVALGGCSPFAGGGQSGGATSTSAGQSTPTSTTQEQLAHLMYLDIWGLGVQKLETAYDAQHATVKVTITLGGTTPNTNAKADAAQELTKSFCLMAQQALWTTSGVPLNAATVTILGPMQDEYADTIVDTYGVATVEARTGQRINWGQIITDSGFSTGVSADSAWQEYDHVFLRRTFVVVS